MDMLIDEDVRAIINIYGVDANQCMYSVPYLYGVYKLCTDSLRTVKPVRHAVCRSPWW